MVTGIAKLILRDLVNATVGFEALAEESTASKELAPDVVTVGRPDHEQRLGGFRGLKRALKVEVHMQS